MVVFIIGSLRFAKYMELPVPVKSTFTISEKQCVCGKPSLLTRYLTNLLAKPKIIP